MRATTHDISDYVKKNFSSILTLVRFYPSSPPIELGRVFQGQARTLMAVTMHDVAVAAGVSTATVSNVLNKTGKVGRRTQNLVLSTVRRLGYLPNIHARRLASRDTRTFGIIVSDIENPFFPEIIKSFLARTRQLGYDAILSDTNYDPRRTQEAASRMMAHNVGGVAIMTSEISPKLIDELVRRKIA